MELFHFILSSLIVFLAFYHSNFPNCANDNSFFTSQIEFSTFIVALRDYPILFVLCIMKIYNQKNEV